MGKNINQNNSNVILKDSKSASCYMKIGCSVSNCNECRCEEFRNRTKSRVVKLMYGV